MEPLLFKAVHDVSLDPEQAIFFLNFQNDPEKGKFEPYTTWQYQHPLLPDSLNHKVWLPKLDAQQKAAADAQRRTWHANTLADLALKAQFLAENDLPFIFTGVRKSIGKLAQDLDSTSALQQYMAFTSLMVNTE